MTAKTTTKEDAIRRLKSARMHLISLGVVSIGLFGSFVRGKQTPASDIDILVDFDPNRLDKPLIVTKSYANVFLLWR